MNIHILRFDSLDSTNTEAMDQARRGADEGLCVVARQQTAGRGRRGRTWCSPPDAGLYFSIVLRPELAPDRLPLITLMAGIAVHDAIAEMGLSPDIKWANDILVGSKKIAGILAESVETTTGLAVIIGIGVNLTSSNFPEEISGIATSLAAENTKGLSRSAAAVESLVIKFLPYWYEVLQSENGSGVVVEEWQKRSSYASGKHVRAALGDKVIEGITDGLEQDGSLRIRTGNGVTVVQAGDVERIRSRDQSAGS
ncbi:MAG: biotin--[acetyl-CoA-carboxylase] ligase [Acidobacteria bacterium]|nr:biotin--[acetyl-CoA-carboxylase] ligase [Acidobacteriota bacterium]